MAALQHGHLEYYPPEIIIDFAALETIAYRDSFVLKNVSVSYTIMDYEGDEDNAEAKSDNKIYLSARIFTALNGIVKIGHISDSRFEA